MRDPHLVLRGIFAAVLVTFIPLAAGLDGQSGPPLPATVELNTVPSLQRHALPGDFNGDGRIDLIAGTGSPPSNLLIAIGRGDGTFEPVQPLDIAAEPSAVADINRDGRLDVIARTPHGVVVLPGRGDGTFGSPRMVHAEPWAGAWELRYQFALVADFNGDGHPDVAVPTFIDPLRMLIFPGNGDFTFGPPMELPQSSPIFGGVARDFNGDGRPDLALTGFCCSLGIYMNQGGLVFTRSDVPVVWDLSGIAAGDLNGDGRPDLVIAEFLDWDLPYTDDEQQGRIAVLLGNGNGTFQDPVRYNSGVRGETAVAIGDFTRDGVPDVATGNRSYSRDDDFGIRGWDSVSIFPGTGTGALSAPVTFALSTEVRHFDHSPYTASLHRLVAADVDADGFADVITSPGAILFSRPRVPNRTPTVSAGPDRTVYEEDLVPLLAQATDPDHHWLSFRWLDASGHVISRHPNTVAGEWASGLPSGRHTYTVTVDDGYGGSASDSVTLIGLNPGLRRGWQNRDIGATSPAGSATFDPSTDTFTVLGDGGDIWGTADAFHYLHHPISGDFEIVARVASVEHVHRWTKAGLMIRETLTPGARHASIFATPTTERPVAFQRRPTTNGPSVHTEGPFVAAPVWVSLTRIGDTITARYRVSEAGAWTAIGSQTLPGLPGEVHVGLAVSSHVQGRLARATFDGVHVELFPPFEFTGRFSQDIGAVTARGSSAVANAVFTVRGDGADIWGTADAFHYVYEHISGDFEIVVRAASVEHVDRWTKAGLMIRESLQPGARHASIFATPTTERPVAFQRRPTTNGQSVHTAGAFVGPPVWLSLMRQGDRITARYRLQGSTAWVTIGTQTLSALPQQVLVGLAVSSHVDGVLATATFDGLELRRFGDVPPPTTFVSRDIGATSPAGSTTQEGETIIVRGSGADIWGTADAFHFAHREVTGDFTMDALVESVEAVDRWTKAGLMVRASTHRSSPHAFVLSTPGTERGIAFQGRLTHGASSVQQHQESRVAAPVWLRITRRGTEINGFWRSRPADGWRHMGRFVLPDLPETVLVGLAVTSHREGQLATARFSSVRLERMLDWAAALVGPGASSTFHDGTRFTLSNQGADIWGTSDAFTYIQTRWSGDGTITARLNFLRAVDPWTKAGVMFRESLSPDSRHVFALVSAERGFATQYRASTGGLSATGGSANEAAPTGDFSAPVWVQLTRRGSQFTAAYSVDQVTWRPLGGATVTMGSDIHVGVALTSHDVTQEAQAFFDEVSVGP